MNEIPLYDRDVGLKQRETIETLSEIYSIIITIDQVEKMFIKDVIEDQQEYASLVNKLMAQYNALIANNEKNPDFRIMFGSSINEFTKKYNIIASTGVIRLEKGIPMTVEHANNIEGGGTSANSRIVAEATGNFITIMDAIKLNYRTKDQLHPLLAELLLSVNRIVPSQRKGSEAEKDAVVSRNGEDNKKKLVEWIVKINKMKIDQELDDKEAKELLFDLDVAYKNFYSLLT